MNDEEFLKQAREKMTVAYGWNFRDRKNFEKHAETIRKCFGLASPYDENVEYRIDDCRRETDILIGVHIRRGDYKGWRGGIYYYDDSVYYDKMLQAKGHFGGGGKRVSFLLVSDEKINKNNFEGLDINLGTNHFVEDLYSLSRCDYIIGPPSTYSMWASFYGKVPALEITSAKQAIDVKCFTVASG
ncbi:MAG TPA: alpha-1,2-fucosyltransferase [Thermodesulfobacteriota bacterium]|nr:alpha-1,2-fucosyltransferase [Thermodesulfobacteriota bacterium]